MESKYGSHFKNYIQLRKEIDRRAEFLQDAHSKHISCKSGCDLCCMDYSILPIEFFAIACEIKESGSNQVWQKTENPADCIFLTNHSCSIYEFRPVMCRTQGLPLLFSNEDCEWELSACELNFKDFDFEEFALDNTFPQDKYNSKLFMLNKSFVASYEEKKYGNFDLIPLKDLSNHL